MALEARPEAQMLRSKATTPNGSRIMKPKDFLKAVDTLKLYRRAELTDEQGQKLIKALYVDPLPGDHTLETLLRPNTTFLIGRKGTGKSTIIQRAQDSLNQEKQSTWAYIDIKTLYESSTSEVVGTVPDAYQNAISAQAIQKIGVFQNFVLEFVKEIKSQIDQRVKSNMWNLAKESFTGSASELFEQLDEFVEELNTYKYLDVTGSVKTEREIGETEQKQSKTGADAKATISGTPSVNVRVLSELISSNEVKNRQNYSQVFVRIFNIRGLITRLIEILKTLKLRRLYIFIDDFSELPKNEMEEVVDSILAPFNNWSDEFIKLKIAIYPGRLYAGDIDLSKTDEVYLDIYRAYGQNDVSGMEEKAIDFTKRLINKRIEHFCKQGPENYFDDVSNEFYRTLFFSCLGNPRILGYVLYYCYETAVIYEKKIGVAAIQDAARRYYEEKIYHYFRLNKFLHESFAERSSIYSLKELLEEIVKRAKELRSYQDSKVFRDLRGRPPTSHFHVLEQYDQVLSSLELNFFITKYYEMKNRDGKNVSVYALNYGLCQQQTISFGRPTGRREYRLYFVERVFDYSPIIVSYIKVNQEIVCENCGQRHGYDMLAAIQAFDMLCPRCKKGNCRVVNLSRKYESLVKSIADENLLPSTELGILKTLHDERKKMFASQIAAELDCSYQLVGKRGRNLSDRNLVIRGENEARRRVFEISDAAEEIYFMQEPADEMEF